MKPVILEHSYEAAPERVWALATDYAALAQVCAGVVAFDGLPEGRTYTGQRVEVMVSLFGKLPAQHYEMEVVLCDNEGFVLQSSERGAGVKSWRHRLTVRADGAGSVLRDEIEIDAGLMTPLFRMWARYLYGRRHEPRVAMLAEGVF